MPWSRSHPSFSRTRGGDPGVTVPAKHDTLVFPAHTGVIPLVQVVGLLRKRFSRTRGGDPKVFVEEHKMYRCFPHTRGIDYIK